MTIRDEIIAIANQLANQGKKPSVALIKNKLSQPTPLPTLISTLKTWQHEPEKCDLPDSPKDNEVENKGSPLSLEQLEQHLAPIKSDIAEIKALLLKLVNDKSE